MSTLKRWNGTQWVPVGSDTFITSAAATIAFAGFVKAPTDGTSAVAAFQAAINAAAGRPLFVPPGEYRFDDSVAGLASLGLAPNARLLGLVNKPIFEVTGSGSETSRALQADAAAGQNIINCNTVGLAVGDSILIRSNVVFPGSTAGSKIGEMHKIRQIDGTTQLRTLSNLDHNYVVSGTSVVRFGMMRGVGVMGGELVNTIGDALKVPMLRLTACTNAAVDTVITGAGGPGITLSAVSMSTVKARIRESINNEGTGNFGYGVEAFGATNHCDVHVDMVGGRHAFTTTSGATTSAVPRHITVTGTAEGTTNTAWDSHEEGEFIEFNAVKAFGCRNGAIKHRAPNSTIIDPIVRNCLGIAVRFASTAFGGTLRGGELRDVRYLSEGSPGLGVQIEANDVVVSGDPRIDCDDQAILISSGANNSIVKSGTLTAGRRGNADTNVAIDYQGTSTKHRIDRNVSIESAAVGIRKAPTVTDVRVAPIRNEALTQIAGDVHLTKDALRPRLVNIPANTVRATLAVTAGRAYLIPLTIEDDRPWSALIPKVFVTTAGAAADTIEIAIYDTARNRLATTGPQTGLDVVGVKTMPTLAVSPLLGRRYLAVVQVVIPVASTPALAMYAGSFAAVGAQALPGMTDDTYGAAYISGTTAIGSPLSGSPVTTSGVSVPWVQFTPEG